MRQSLKAAVALVVLGFALFGTGCGRSQQSAESVTTATYEAAGISFQYPADWRAFPSEAVSQMKTQVADGLQEFGRTLVSLDMYGSPDGAAAFFVSKTQADSTLSADDILAERRRVYDDATAAGDVTSVNELEKTTLNGLPAVIEDVERSNGGRGHTVKLLQGRFIIELSLVVNDKGEYDKHIGEFEHTLATLKLQD